MLFLTCSLLLLIGIFLAALPYFLDRTTVRDQVTAQLSEWAGTSIEVNGEIAISYFPKVTLAASDVKVGRLWPLQQVSSVSAKRLETAIDWLPLILGQVHVGELMMQDPVVVLDKEDAPHGPEGSDNNITTVATLPPIARFLKRASVKNVVIHGGKVVLPLSSGQEKDITDINAQIKIAVGKVSASGSGSFKWRDRAVSFNVESDPVSSSDGNAKTNTHLKLTADDMKADFRGEVSIFDNLQLNGQLDASAADLRRMASWLGYNLPDGSGLKAFRAVGTFSWVAGRLAFSNAKFDLDGNKAAGAMSLDHHQDGPPQFEGTLALDTLDITDYLVSPAGIAGDGQELGKLSDGFNLALLRHFNADLRLSAATIIAGNIKAERSAITITIDDGTLVADFADVALFDGTGRGKLEVNLASQTATFGLSGSLLNARCGDLFSLFKISPVVTGKSSVSANLTATGDTANELLQSVRGLVKLKMPTGGNAAISLPALVQQASRSDGEGWGHAIDGRTSFKDLVADFQIRDGLANIRDFRVQTDFRTVTASGTLDVKAKSIDWTVVISHGDDVRGRGVRGQAVSRNVLLSLRGPWARPVIRDRDANRADLPSYFGVNRSPKLFKTANH